MIYEFVRQKNRVLILRSQGKNISDIINDVLCEYEANASVVVTTEQIK